MASLSEPRRAARSARRKSHGQEWRTVIARQWPHRHTVMGYALIRYAIEQARTLKP